MSEDNIQGYNEFYLIGDRCYEDNVIESTNHDNISFKIQVKDFNEIWYNDNITTFNNSIIEFKVEIETMRGYQLIAAALSLPNTNNGSLLSLFNNSFQCSKKPTLMDISNRDIVLLWLPVLLPTKINFNFKAKIQNLGVEKEILGAIIGSIDNDSFDISNKSFYITSIPSPIPEIPNQPEGPSTGLPDIIYNYSTKSVDPDGDQVYYKWDWVDETSGWLGPYDSGEECVASHSWEFKRFYNIKVKVKDVDGWESDWSDPLGVNIPKKKSFNFNSLILVLLFERFPFLQPYFSQFFD
jgi:hypothetical protein